VNSPGEAKHADVGLAGGVGVGLLIEDGEIVRKYQEAEMVDALMARIEEKARQIESGIGGGTEDTGLLKIAAKK
jgi:(E)-4-hydroxy-3-methylbut-2-enyl-diphosphate synthase